MGEAMNIRDVNPLTKAKLTEDAAAANMSLSAYVRQKLDEIAGTPKRQLGALERKYGSIPDPTDGWEAMTDGELNAIESDHDLPLA